MIFFNKKISEKYVINKGVRRTKENIHIQDNYHSKNKAAVNEYFDQTIVMQIIMEIGCVYLLNILVYRKKKFKQKNFYLL